MDNVLGSLHGPLAGGAVTTPLRPTATGRIAVKWTSRRPVVLAILKAPLRTESIVIETALHPSNNPKTVSTCRFESYSEGGASLPIYAPNVANGIDSIGNFTLGLKASIVAENGAPVAIPPAQLSLYFRFEMVEGNVGKMLLALMEEKARIRRQVRELAAMKQLAGARRDALDRIGAGLGVLRFQDELAYDPVKEEVLTVILKDADGNSTLESDADYARRLGVYRPFLLSSRARFQETLNGDGEDTDPNRGLLSGLGLTSRFKIQEENNPFALAFRIVGVGSAAPRMNFLNYIRNDVLIWIANTSQANNIHNARYLPQTTRERVEQLRARLRDAYHYPIEGAVAPMLANALDRFGRVLKALGVTQRTTINRAQADAEGSRYEFGLGADIFPLTAGDLDDVVARINDTSRAITDDDEAEALITVALAAPPVPAAQDKDASWLLKACGFQTIHRLSPTSLYISHLPTLGLQVDGPTTVPVGGTANYEAHFYPSEDAAVNVVLYSGLNASRADWVAAGHTGWTQLTTAQALTAWGTAITQAANAQSLQVFTAAGLPAVANPTSLINSIKNVPADMLATITLDPALSGQILAGQPAAIKALTSLVALFTQHSLASAVPLVTNTNQVLLLVSVLGLPQVGVNLSERRTSGFRWYAVPLGGNGTVKAIGSGTTLQGTDAGAMALVCLGYVRQGLADPYEVKIDLPEGETITLKEYEFLMNTLEQLCPIGVEINTYSIRQNHVDLAGDGIAKPLKPSVFRTYRSFRRRRLRGIYQEG